MMAHSYRWRHHRHQFITYTLANYYNTTKELSPHKHTYLIVKRFLIILLALCFFIYFVNSLTLNQFFLMDGRLIIFRSVMESVEVRTLSTKFPKRIAFLVHHNKMLLSCDADGNLSVIDVITGHCSAIPTSPNHLMGTLVGDGENFIALTYAPPSLRRGTMPDKETLSSSMTATSKVITMKLNRVPLVCTIHAPSLFVVLPSTGHIILCMGLLTYHCPLFRLSPTGARSLHRQVSSHNNNHDDDDTQTITTAKEVDDTDVNLVYDDLASTVEHSEWQISRLLSTKQTPTKPWYINGMTLSHDHQSLIILDGGAVHEINLTTGEVGLPYSRFQLNKLLLLNIIFHYWAFLNRFLCDIIRNIIESSTKLGIMWSQLLFNNRYGYQFHCTIGTRTTVTIVMSIIITIATIACIST
jgi:hypothetical protein